MPPAAAVPVSIAVGSVQKVGAMADWPICDSTIADHQQHRIFDEYAHRKPKERTGSRQRRYATVRSPVRSECRPHSTIAQAPATKGWH